MFPVIKKTVKKFLLEEHGKITKKSIIAMGIYASLMSVGVSAMKTATDGGVTYTWSDQDPAVNPLNAHGMFLDEFPATGGEGYYTITTVVGEPTIDDEDTRSPIIADGEMTADVAAISAQSRCTPHTPPGWTITEHPDTYTCSTAFHMNHCGKKHGSAQISQQFTVKTNTYNLDRTIICPVIAVTKPWHSALSYKLNLNPSCEVTISANTHTNTMMISNDPATLDVITATHNHSLSNPDDEPAIICIGSHNSPAIENSDQTYKYCEISEHCNWCCG